MAIWVAVTAALGASTCGATASALQHRTAAHISGDGGPVATTRATVAQLPWLAALAVQGMGFLLHALALRSAQLTVVQPLLVCAVLFALPLNRLFRQERITSREISWALVLVVGLAGFLVIGTPSTPSPAQPVDIGPAIGFGVTGVAAVVVCTVISRRTDTERSLGAAILGIAAGILYAGQAALLKASVTIASHGIDALLTAWQPYALIVAGLTAILFTQMAFRRGPLSASLPLVATINPVLGIVIGSAVYDENIRDSASALAAEVVFLVLLTAATLMLTRSEYSAGRSPARGPSGEHGRSHHPAT